MFIKKCNICKNQCAKYLFGMPNFAAIQEDLDKGKIVLGGCVISIPSPSWHCKTCSIDFYVGGFGIWTESDYFERKEARLEGEILNDFEESFEEEKSYQLLPEILKSFLKEANDMNVKDQNFAFKFKIGGYTSSEKTEYIFFKNALIKYISETSMPRFPYSVPDSIYFLNKQQLIKLKTFFLENKWKRTYRNIDVFDGTEWSLEAKFKKVVIESYGHMNFPKVYEEFVDVLEEMMSVESFDY